MVTEWTAERILEAEETPWDIRLEGVDEDLRERALGLLAELDAHAETLNDPEARVLVPMLEEDGWPRPLAQAFALAEVTTPADLEVPPPPSRRLVRCSSCSWLAGAPEDLAADLAQEHAQATGHRTLLDTDPEFAVLDFDRFRSPAVDRPARVLADRLTRAARRMMAGRIGLWPTWTRPPGLSDVEADRWITTAVNLLAKSTGPRTAAMDTARSEALAHVFRTRDQAAS